MWCAYKLSLYHSTALSHYKTLHTLSPKKATRRPLTLRVIFRTPNPKKHLATPTLRVVFAFCG